MLEKLVESCLHIDRHIRLLELIDQWRHLFVVCADASRDVTGHVDSGDDDSDYDGEGDGDEDSEAKMLDLVKTPSFSLMIIDNQK
jgi:hypothetical protein